jgi:hypothetical protein
VRVSGHAMHEAGQRPWAAATKQSIGASHLDRPAFNSARRLMPVLAAFIGPSRGNSSAPAILNHLRTLPRGGGDMSLSPPNRSRKASACAGSAKQKRT